jgi:hypothetical protein
MKLWIRHENRYGLVRVANSISFSKEDALQLATANNKYLYPTDFKALDIQPIEIDSDYLIYLLMETFHVQDWKGKILQMADNKNPMIHFGETVMIPDVEHVVLD